MSPVEKTAVDRLGSEPGRWELRVDTPFKVHKAWIFFLLLEDLGVEPKIGVGFYPPKHPICS